jgi:SAM-dependent methyltransferase
MIGQTMRNFDLVMAIIEHYRSGDVDKTVSQNDAMNNQWYFEIGVSAVENIVLACFSSTLGEIHKVLDVPCGHGRVLRHLVKMFPCAQVYACDLDADGVEFCVATFGATPVYSKSDLAMVDFGSKFDLIWIGSLLTHVSRAVAKRWLGHLAGFLSPHGIIVATVHGRWCEHVHNVVHYIGEDRWKKIISEFSTDGYGYSDYVSHESHPYISGSYGISLVKPHITIQDVEEIPGIRIFLYRERGWADHQDVVAFGKPSFDMPWPGM